MRPSRRTAQKRKLPAGARPPTRLLTCRGTRSTSGPSLPRHGCPSTAPHTGCARSTRTNRGTTNCGPKPSITVARPRMPTLRTIRGCSVDQLAGADDLEVLVDEDVVGPVDADVVDLVLAVAQLDNAVDGAAWIGGQRRFGRLVRCRSADDRPGALAVVRRDLAVLRRRSRCSALEGDHRRR